MREFLNSHAEQSHSRVLRACACVWAEPQKASLVGGVLTLGYRRPSANGGCVYDCPLRWRWLSLLLLVCRWRTRSFRRQAFAYRAMFRQQPSDVTDELWCCGSRCVANLRGSFMAVYVAALDWFTRNRGTCADRIRSDENPPHINTRDDQREKPGQANLRTLNWAQ